MTATYFGFWFSSPLEWYHQHVIGHHAYRKSNEGLPATELTLTTTCIPLTPSSPLICPGRRIWATILAFVISSAPEPTESVSESSPTLTLLEVHYRRCLISKVSIADATKMLKPLPCCVHETVHFSHKQYAVRVTCCPTLLHHRQVSKRKTPSDLARTSDISLVVGSDDDDILSVDGGRDGGKKGAPTNCEMPGYSADLEPPKCTIPCPIRCLWSLIHGVGLVLPPSFTPFSEQFVGGRESPYLIRA
jgi:hypothetical protein